jgi:hypothetical protein
MLQVNKAILITLVILAPRLSKPQDTNQSKVITFLLLGRNSTQLNDSAVLRTPAQHCLPKLITGALLDKFLQL